ncbi:hypothetical protein F5148DRAFT_977513 [Russula earlei]|uniref:Uncharacterized protein n=1 Tax=Russula earlei TaxID=71964 RepID=A0ACC0UGJ7_9AGAM|nr:hypothetical protein F5148DRAFT_977513 [Russula earlei]
MSSSSESHDPPDLEYARLVDTDYLVRRSMTKGYQLFSIITPPLYAGFTLFRRSRGHLTVSRLLRATWLGGAAGIAGGGAVEYVRSTNSSSETLRSRRILATIDVSISIWASHRADDHATIGALLCAVLIPALFWKRATIIHRRYLSSLCGQAKKQLVLVVFGGAGLGTAAGYFTHVARSASGDVPLTPVIPPETSYL